MYHLKAALVGGLVLSVVAGVLTLGPGFFIVPLLMLSVPALPFLLVFVATSKDSLAGCILIFPAMGVPVWIVAWLVGLLVLWFFHRGKPTTEDGGALATDLVPAGVEDRVSPIAQYIRKAERQGSSPMHVKAVLAANGWGQDDIAEAYRRLGR